MKGSLASLVESEEDRVVDDEPMLGPAHRNNNILPSVQKQKQGYL